jgi:hypothetical protein
MIEDGHIHKLLSGRKVKLARKTGQFLILELDDGHCVKIGWTNGNGQLVKGEPILCGVDVNVQIQMPPLGGEVGE